MPQVVFARPQNVVKISDKYTHFIICHDLAVSAAIRNEIMAGSYDGGTLTYHLLHPLQSGDLGSFSIHIYKVKVGLRLILLRLHPWIWSGFWVAPSYLQWYCPRNLGCRKFPPHHSDQEPQSRPPLRSSADLQLPSSPNNEKDKDALPAQSHIQPPRPTSVAARKDVTLWKRFMPPLPRLLGGLFAGLLMVHLSIPNQVVSSNELICSSVWDLQCGLAHKRVTAGGRSLSPHRNAFAEA